MRTRITKNKSGEFVPVLTRKDFFGKTIHAIDCRNEYSAADKARMTEAKRVRRMQEIVRQREIDEERRAKEARRAAFDAWWEEKQQCEKWDCTPPERPNLWN